MMSYINCGFVRRRGSHKPADWVWISSPLIDGARPVPGLKSNESDFQCNPKAGAAKQQQGAQTGQSLMGVYHLVLLGISLWLFWSLLLLLSKVFLVDPILYCIFRYLAV